MRPCILAAADCRLGRYDDKTVLPAAEGFEYPLGLAEYTVTGMNAALALHNVTGTPKVALAIGLGADGIVDLIHADAKIHSMDLVKKQRFVKKNVTVEQCADWLAVCSHPFAGGCH